MDKKGKIRAGLTFGVAMAVFFILKDLLMAGDLTTRRVFVSVISGFFGGALAGLVFGWIIGWLANSKLLARGTNIDIHEDETILFETGGNHLKGIEAVGGKLYLTNKRLIFKSHTFNIQNHALSIILHDIKHAERYHALGITNNGIKVTTTGNKIERFVVQQPEECFELLQKNNELNASIQ